MQVNEITLTLIKLIALQSLSTKNFKTIAVLELETKLLIN
jgi:hypothetical protein